MDPSLANLPPGDLKVVNTIVNQLKSQGMFDQFRRDCLNDVDTKPAYQNLRQRVEGHVSNFLQAQRWRPGLNKNQLRDSLRRHVNQSGMLEIGVDRIVDQVVNPKVYRDFLPQIEEVAFKLLGRVPPPTAGSSQSSSQTVEAKPSESTGPESTFSSPQPVVPQSSATDPSTSNSAFDQLLSGSGHSSPEPLAPGSTPPWSPHRGLDNSPVSSGSLQIDDDDDEPRTPPYELFSTDTDVCKTPPLAFIDTEESKDKKPELENRKLESECMKPDPDNSFEFAIKKFVTDSLIHGSEGKKYESSVKTELDLHSRSSNESNSGGGSYSGGEKKESVKRKLSSDSGKTDVKKQNVCQSDTKLKKSDRPAESSESKWRSDDQKKSKYGKQEDKYGKDKRTSRDLDEKSGKDRKEAENKDRSSKHPSHGDKTSKSHDGRSKESDSSRKYKDDRSRSGHFSKRDSSSKPSEDRMRSEHKSSDKHRSEDKYRSEDKHRTSSIKQGSSQKPSSPSSSSSSSHKHLSISEKSIKSGVDKSKSDSSRTDKHRDDSSKSRSQSKSKVELYKSKSWDESKSKSDDSNSGRSKSESSDKTRSDSHYRSKSDKISSDKTGSYAERSGDKYGRDKTDHYSSKSSDSYSKSKDKTRSDSFSSKDRKPDKYASDKTKHADDKTKTSSSSSSKRRDDKTRSDDKSRGDKISDKKHEPKSKSSSDYYKPRERTESESSSKHRHVETGNKSLKQDDNKSNRKTSSSSSGTGEKDKTMKESKPEEQLKPAAVIFPVPATSETAFTTAATTETTADKHVAVQEESANSNGSSESVPHTPPKAAKHKMSESEGTVIKKIKYDETDLEDPEQQQSKRSVLLDETVDEEFVKPFGVEEERGNVSDVTVSSVHTSDLSDYEDEVSFTDTDCTEDKTNSPVKKGKDVKSLRKNKRTVKKKLLEDVSVGPKVKTKIEEPEPVIEATKVVCPDPASTRLSEGEPRREMRRQRKVNPRYASDDFASIFTKQKGTARLSIGGDDESPATTRRTTVSNLPDEVKDEPVVVAASRIPHRKATAAVEPSVVDDLPFSPRSDVSDGDLQHSFKTQLKDPCSKPHSPTSDISADSGNSHQQGPRTPESTCSTESKPRRSTSSQHYDASDLYKPRPNVRGGRRNRSSDQQRYDDSDLYKPRPVITSSSRRYRGTSPLPTSTADDPPVMSGRKGRGSTSETLQPSSDHQQPFTEKPSPEDLADFQPQPANEGKERLKSDEESVTKKTPIKKSRKSSESKGKR